ncbi:MAG TPA: hypothetical protein PKJ45_10125 [Rubrivivax sp.]|nr:hypothetical protein [Rubrivivax sp.]
MALKLKPDDVIDRYRVLNCLDDKRTACASRYGAVEEHNASPVEVWSYNSPGTSSKGFPHYVESRKALLQRLEAQSDAAGHVVRMHGVYAGISVRGHANPKVVLITEPAPPALADRLEGKGLDPGSRWSLARQLAVGVAALHRAGIDWTLIDPWHIGVRDDGSPVLLDLLCARVHEDFQHWDLPFMTDGYTAPELLEGEDSSPAADVYALAATLVRLLTDAGTSDFLASEDGVVFLEGLPAFDRPLVAGMLRAALSDDTAARPSAAALAACFAERAERVTEAGLPAPSDWLTSPMQALAFWVGYQHCVYRHHDLPEGAIVAEFTRLVDAEIGLQRIVVREPMYRDLLAAAGAGWRDGSRCDLAVRGRGSGKQQGPVEAVVEVKRASVPDSVIDGDLLALHQLKKADPSIRAFLLLVAQASWPRRWVSHLGTANPDVESFTVVDSGGHEQEVNVRVRRVTKAAHSFRSISTATYCCLLEVL